MSYRCGIDIGSRNLSFTFLTPGRIVSYLGDVSCMMRFEEGSQPVEIAIKVNKTAPVADKLIALLETLPELASTDAFIVEQQMNNMAMNLTAGIICGFLRGRGLSGGLMGGQTRKNFATSFSQQPFEQADVKELIGHKIPENKLSSVGFVGEKFPTFLAYIVNYMNTLKPGERKIDDICDSIIYAYMCQQEITSSQKLSKAKKVASKAVASA